MKETKEELEDLLDVLSHSLERYKHPVTREQTIIKQKIYKRYEDISVEYFKRYGHFHPK